MTTPTSSIWPEILLIDKPAGITSFDVIRKLRKIYTDKTGQRAPKLGHAGTLDPAATGLMILGVGNGTKQLTEYIKLDKEYVAEVLIGRSTTTGDADGDIVSEAPITNLAEADIAKAIKHLHGTLRLPVSAFSAIKKDGVPFYKRAHEAAKIGELITDVPYRDMRVDEAELLDVYEIDGGVVAQVRFAVGSGTYIRSLAEELGRRLGYPASLTGLRRTRIGDLSIKKARMLTDL